MICPVCEREGQKSKVYAHGMTKTLMGYGPPYYDEEGTYHNHDANRREELYSCSNKHLFQISHKGSCPCGWTGGERKITELGERPSSMPLM